MPAKDTITVASRIPKETAEQIDLIVEASGTSHSKVVARLIEGGLSALRNARKSNLRDDDVDTMLDEEETENE